MNYETTEVLNLIFGTSNFNTVIAGFFYCCTGLLFSIGIRVYAGIENTTNGSPDTFNLAYLWQNNKAEILLGFFATMICMRFSGELLARNATMWLACLLGFANYRLVRILSKALNTLLNVTSLTKPSNDE